MEVDESKSLDFIEQESDFIEQESVDTWGKWRSEVRKLSKINDNVRISLQTMDYRSVSQLLEGMAAAATTAVTKKACYEGLLNVLHELTATNTVSGKLKGVLPFKEAYELYSSAFHSGLLEPQLQNFRDHLLSDDIGLPVAYFFWNDASYIVLDPQSWDISQLLDIFLIENTVGNSSAKRFDLNATSLKTIINSMESEYDKSVVRALIAATSSRSAIYNLGLDPQRAVSSLEKIINISREIERAVVAGEDMTILALNEKIERKEKEIKSLEESYNKLRQIGANSIHLNGLLEKIEACKKSIKAVQDVLNCEDAYTQQKFKAAARRRTEKLVEENRMRHRASGAGAKRKLDEIDEEFIAKAIEQKTSAHGRRHDMVLYYHKRLKRDDLLSVANYHLLERGKQMIKSATTVYNRGKPKRIRLLQAKRHIGKALFCSKKPPKTGDSDNILTHHQRKHVELAKLHLYSSPTDYKWAVDVSADDKAYIRPETSVGMDGTKHQSLIQPTVDSGLEIRALPSHDFCDSRLYITPSAYRFMSHELKELDGKQRAVLKDDNSMVTVRPKHYIGSSGSIWASENVYLRWNHPQLYEVEGSDLHINLRKFSAMVRDILFYFVETTDNADVMSVTNDEHCQFRQYANCCVEHALIGIIRAQSDWNNSRQEVVPSQIAIGNEISDTLNLAISEMEIVRDTLYTNNETIGDPLWQKFAKCLETCKQIMANIKVLGVSAIPRPRFLMRTDKGPGVSLTNYEVQIRDAELVRLYNLDWQMRIHLAVNDPCPAERTNACIGDAVSDGGSIDFLHYKPLQEMDNSELEKISSDDLKRLEEESVQKNIWNCCHEITQRIDDAPGPHGYMSAHVTPRPELQFFYNTKYLLQYHTAGSTSESVPGYSYFQKVEQFMEDHYNEGENYREFVKFSCQNSDCSFCTEWVGPEITACPRPMPDPTCLPDLHYLPYARTPVNDREIDDFQPRAQLKIAFAESIVSSSNEESVSTFADKYVVQPKLVLEFVQHLEAKQFRKVKRSKYKLKEKQLVAEKVYTDYEWKDLMKNENDLKKLTVKELNKYLVHHNLLKQMKLKKADKILIMLQHWHSHVVRQEEEPTEDEQDESDEEDDDDNDEYDEHYDDSDDDDMGDDKSDEQYENDIVLSVIGSDLDTDPHPSIVSRSGRKIVSRNLQSDFFYF